MIDEHDKPLTNHALAHKKILPTIGLAWRNQKKLLSWLRCLSSGIWIALVTSIAEYEQEILFILLDGMVS